jgi:hypothetical protein
MRAATGNVMRQAAVKAVMEVVPLHNRNVENLQCVIRTCYGGSLNRPYRMMVNEVDFRVFRVRTKEKIPPQAE